jgi:hypothetical protein
MCNTGFIAISGVSRSKIQTVFKQTFRKKRMIILNCQKMKIGTGSQPFIIPESFQSIVFFIFVKVFE